ncbi:MAG: flagellar brake protein [Burkholderiales bacterium]|nr:flagellar brake protein [Burkholderiales bacterium]
MIAHPAASHASPHPEANAAPRPANANIRGPLNESAAELDPYRIGDRCEVLGLLRSIQHQRCPVTVYFNQGTDFFQSMLIAVNPRFEELIFDIGNDVQFNARLEAARDATFVTRDHEVRVQFSSGQVELVLMDGQPAFRVPVPPSVVRLQRRNFYRIATPVANPLLIRVPDASGLSGFSGRVSCRVLDLSCGGASILVPDDRLAARVDERFDDCVLELGPDGDIHLTLEVRHAAEERSGGKLRGIRLRCRFRSLGESGEQAIQRYVRRLEIERRERL